MTKLRINGHSHLLPYPEQIPTYLKEKEIFWIDADRKYMLQKDWKRPVTDSSFFLNEKLEWMEKNNYPKPPRSACTFCPYHSNEEWKEIKKNKEEWDEVVALDKKIRFGSKNKVDPVFLHKSCVPIEEADLEPNKDQQDLFNDICDEGMCGV